ncbi:GDSL-type esterase/lipase family protein [Sphingomonas sp.]|uniref:GDSL-type esterase/lipase family protein n=1 Tax=Sphingomonas sp. TaxID=28214 RepID=UPI0031D0D218
MSEWARMRIWGPAAVAVAAAFLWGLAVGFYHVFPYEPIRQLKNLVEGDRKPAERPMVTNPAAETVALGDRDLPAVAADVVMAGDSITAGGRWGELFPGMSILNRGVGGDMVTGLAKRTDEILAHRPRVVVVMIGVNDLLSGNTARQILPVYGSLLAKLRAGGAQVIVQPVLCGTRCSDEQRVELAATNRALPALAARHGARFLDLRPDFDDAKGVVRGELTWDGLHFTGAGYRAWQRRLAPAIAEALR